MQPFVHIHVHSQYSLLDGQASIARLVDKAMKDGMTALALTDHGVMYGVKDFVNYVSKKNAPVKSKIKKIESELLKVQNNSQDIALSDDNKATEQQLKEKLSLEQKNLFKPIIGCECYLARRDRFQQKDKVDSSGWHLVVLAKNFKGYQNLIKIVSKSWTEGFYYRPRIDKELLEKYSENV